MWELRLVAFTWVMWHQRCGKSRVKLSQVFILMHSFATLKCPGTTCTQETPNSASILYETLECEFRYNVYFDHTQADVRYKQLFGLAKLSMTLSTMSQKLSSDSEKHVNRTFLEHWPKWNLHFTRHWLDIAWNHNLDLARYRSICESPMLPSVSQSWKHIMSVICRCCRHVFAGYMLINKRTST